jgi:hypothetical protein
MKTKIYIASICFLTIYSFLYTSCDNDDTTKGDTTKPVINLIEPEEGDSILIGDKNGIHFDAEFSDNEMLASYKVEIHNNFNDHSHSSLRAAGETIAFAFDSIWDLSDKKNTYEHHHYIRIPENAMEGKYHLMVYCADAAGNESHVARNIVLSHEASEHHDDDEHEHEHEAD